MADSGMREFWEERANEDPFYFVHDGMRYGDADLDAFWASGEEALGNLLSYLGVAIESQDTVVEIGCGVGRMTRAIASRAGSVIALDVSARMLELAREHNPALTNVEWILGDGTTLSGVDDASADGCVSNVVFQHIPDPRVTLGYVREMGRVLRPGGWSAFQVSNDPSVHRSRRGGRLRSALRRGPRGTDAPAWLGSAVSLDDLAKTAGDVDMDVASIFGEGTQFCGVLLRRR